MNTLEDVYQEWQNNPLFREEFKLNPEEALKNAGLKIQPSDLVKIKAFIDKADNDELAHRINK